MFKTLIVENKIDFDSMKIIEFILKLKKESKGKKASNIGGWQSEFLDFNNPILVNLTECIMQQGKEFCNILDVREDLTLYISSMWANVNEYKDSNQEHIHSGSLLSGVVYLKVPKKDCGYLEFIDPSVRLKISISGKPYDEIYEKFNDFTTLRVQVIPTEKHIILFPSWLPHLVLPHLSHNLRISVSFNLNIK